MNLSIAKYNLIIIGITLVFSLASNTINATNELRTTDHSEWVSSNNSKLKKAYKIFISRLNPQSNLFQFFAFCPTIHAKNRTTAHLVTLKLQHKIHKFILEELSAMHGYELQKYSNDQLS